MKSSEFLYDGVAIHIFTDEDEEIEDDNGIEIANIDT